MCHEFQLLVLEVFVVSDQSDAKCLRNLSLMSAGLFGMFLTLLALSQLVTG
jgi:hypothetical protein